LSTLGPAKAQAIPARSVTAILSMFIVGRILTRGVDRPQIDLK
jgi:hypothetical protein